jgi:capsular exopolysaccharide synthesis family protein
MSTQASSTDTIDLLAIFRKVLAKWWWFAITVTISLAAAVAYIKTTPKVYQVQALMLMGERSRNAFGNQEEFLKGTSYLRSSAELEDKVAVMTSRSNVTKTLKRLNFEVSYFERANFLTTEKYDYPPFHVVLDTVAVQVISLPVYVEVDRDRGVYRVKAKGERVFLYNVKEQTVLDEVLPEYEVDQEVPIGQPFVARNLSFAIDFPADRSYDKDTKYFFTVTSLEDLVVDYRSATTASPLSKESNIVVLQLKGEVIRKQRAFLNKLMETYIEGELYKQQQKGLKTINFIDDQIGSVSDSLRRSESSMASFRGASGGMMSATTTSDALFQERSRLEDERSSLQRRREYCASILDKIRSSSDLRNVPAPTSSGIDDPAMNNLVIEITKLSSELAALNLTTVKSNPAIISMERKLTNLTSTLAQNAESLVRQADMSLAEVDRRLGRIGYEFNKLPENERKLGVLERKFKLNESLYNYLMEKRAEAGIAIASDQVDKSVVDEARMEGRKAIAPNKKVVLGGALFIGLFIPLGLILVRDFFNDRVTDLEELKRFTAIPVLATIPSSKRKRIVKEDQRSRLTEAFRTARINLQYLNADRPRQVIGLTSSTSGEGKTFCSVNLATVMALSGKRTLLLDADLRRPNVGRTMDMSDEGVGLSTWLIGECTLDAMIKKTDIEGLEVITAGPIPPNPLELIEDPRFGDLIAQLRARYDQIVIDASPLGLVSEYVIVMRHLDLSLFVVRERYTKRGSLRFMNELVQERKIERVDILLNDVKDMHANGYGYYTK